MRHRFHPKALLAFIGICLWASSAIGQVSGIVRDAESGDSLAFAYILSLGTKNGCFSGLDGHFSLPTAAPQDSLRISLLGYVSQTVAVHASQRLSISLKPGGVCLGDVVIQPRENPALRIMRLAVENRQENDPLNFSHFSFDTYNKLYGTPLYPRSMADSLRLKFHLFLSETVTHRVQVRPGKVQEQIVSARLAGYPGKVIPFTASDLQDLSFYSNYIGVFGQKFLSPVSPPGLNQYSFSLRDTLLDGEDSIFTIDFAPLHDHFDGFEGNLRIHSSDWSLLTVDVKLVVNEGGILIQSGEIKQVYTQLPSGTWVPSELYTELDTKPLSGGDPFRFHFSGYSSMRNHVLGDSAKTHFRPEDELVVAEQAGVEDSLLQARRSIPLSHMDATSYRKLDSIGRKVGLSKVVDQAWKLSDVRLGVGVVDILLDRISNQNRVERWRGGIGLVTNEQMSRRFSIGGFIGWGIRDREAKYGAQFQLTPFKDDRLYAGIGYTQDLVESGFRRLGLRPERQLHQDIYRKYGLRRWYLTDMEYVENKEVWLGTRLPSDLGLRTTLRSESVTPAYDYTYADTGQFKFAEAEIVLRWAPGARYIQNSGRRILSSNKAPVLHLRYTRGFENQWGDYAYNAAALSLSHKFSAFRGGKGSVILHAGWNDRSLPRSRMRVYRSNYAKRNFADLTGAFNTMRYDEFAADVFAEGFVYVSPKLRWLKIGPRIQPQLNFSMAAAWGMLYAEGRNLHTSAPLQAPKNWYLEPGLSLTRLLPAPRKDNVVSSWIRSVGVGAYYRVGAYSLPTFKENIALRLSFGGF